MVFCKNCQSEIEDSKMFLHEGFCKKNIKYCFKCKEKVPIEEYEEHLENHNNNKKEEEKKENKKEEEKENIGIECQYCSLLVDNNEIEEHEKMCGSRTVECEICGQYVQTRLLNQHLNVIHDVGYKDNNNNNFNKEEYNKQKQIEEDEILARKLAEEYNRFDMNNSFRHF